MKAFKQFLIYACSIGFLLSALIYGWVVYTIHTTKTPGPLPETKIVLIDRGKGVSAIAEILEFNRVINSALLFKAAVYLEDDKRPLKAGEYEFPAGVSLQTALDMMRDGKVYDRKITIPEGLTLKQIIEILNKDEALSGEIVETPPEGWLLPETYHYIKGDNRQTVLFKMKMQMDQMLGSLWQARSTDTPLKTPEEALTLASIVEKETGVASERAEIAGVFINRLQRGIPLQSDPTVIYAMTKGDIQEAGQGPLGRRLLTKDLEFPSPYNTYLNPGLPPGPIANPGKASIQAVLHPEVHDFIYFVADGRGGHIFARTLEEHNQNVANWRRIRKQSGQ